MKYLREYKLRTIHGLFVAMLVSGSISVAIGIKIVGDETNQILLQTAVTTEPIEHIVARPLLIENHAASNAWQAQRELLRELRMHNVTRNLHANKDDKKNASKPQQQGLPSLTPAPVW